MSSTHGDKASTNRIGSTPTQVSAEHHFGHSSDSNSDRVPTRSVMSSPLLKRREF
jgi:hypothetical protein